jgi:prevent-host-death family protein
MSEKVISVTEAARNFADCLNRARYQGTTFILHKNGVPVARIVPEPARLEAVKPEPSKREPSKQKRKSAGNGPAIIQALRKAREESGLTDEDFKLWRRDLKAARAALIPPADKWQS